MATRISKLTAAGALTGDEQVEITQLSTTVAITAATISALASDNSFNDSGDGFVAAGFAVGNTVRVTGFTGNVVNNIYSGKITALTAGKMTIGGTDGDVIVDDAAGESVTITKWESKRADYGAGGGGGGSPITYVIDTGSTADSDPGAGLLKFNNATQSAATELYIDNAAADAASMATYFASLAQTGFVSLVQGDDPTVWRVFKVTAITDMTGYHKFTVVNQAGAGSFADEAEVFVAFDSSAGTNYVPVVIPVAVGDETTDLTTGTAKITFRMATGLVLTDVRASVTTAPTDAAIQVDINQDTGGGPVSILSTKLTIDATEKTSVTAAVPPVISNPTLASDGEITIDIDSVGSTIAGAGLKVYLVGIATVSGSTSLAELKGLTFTSDTDSTADSDPGAGLFKWNNATQASATELYLDDQTADAVSLTTFYTGIAATGYIYLQQSDDPTKWQLWKWSAVTDGTGYRKFAVAYQAGGGEIDDAKTVYVDFKPDSAGGSVSTVNGVSPSSGDISLNGGHIGVKGADIASAATTNLATATGDWADVTGTTTVTALGTITAGVERLVRFTGILTLTHNGTSLILPTAANITTAAGDFARFRSLGSGNWVCVAYQRASGAALASAGGLTNWTEAVNTSAPNVTVPVASFTATNAATNVDAAFLPKGTGAILGQVPDNTATGGNKRGAGAVDWQRTRNNNVEVASGTEAVIGGGQQNRASGLRSTVAGGINNECTNSFATIGGGQNNNATNSGSTIAGGSGNTSSGEDSAVGGGASNQATGASSTVAGGGSSIASGIGSYIPGGVSNRADGTYTGAMGANAAGRGLYGNIAHASGQFATFGDAQTSRFVLRSDTTNATPEAVTANNNTAGTTNQIILPNTSLYAFRGHLVVRENATGDSKAIEFKGAIKRGANAAATALLGSVTQADLGTPDAGSAAWIVAFTADTTNGGLKIEVTGEASHTLRWVAMVETTEVVG